MNLFDAVPLTVYEELSHEVDYDEVNEFEVRRVFKLVVDRCDNFSHGTLTPRNHMMILRMVKNALGLMLSDDAEERETFYQMIREIKQENVTV